MASYHYSDVIMRAMASQITSVSIVCITIFRVTGLCAGKPPVTGEFPSQRLVTRSFDVFFDLCLNKRLSKQSRGWRLETPSSSSWRHCNEIKENINQSSASPAYGRGIHRWPAGSPHKVPVTRKMFPFDEIIINAILIKFTWCILKKCES